MGAPLQITKSLFLAVFKSLYLHLNFGILILTYLGMGLLGLIFFETLWFLGLYVHFLHQVREVFRHYFFKYILNPFISFFFSYYPYDETVVMLDILRVPLSYPHSLDSFCWSHWVVSATIASKSLMRFSASSNQFSCPWRHSLFQLLYSSLMTGSIFFVFYLHFCVSYLLVEVLLEVTEHPNNQCLELCIC